MKNKIEIIKSIIISGIHSPKKAINLAKSMLFPKKAKVDYFPISADFESTIACNLNCIMCHRKELVLQRESLNMTLDQFKLILGKLPYLLKINLQGMGEPLLSGDIFEMIRYAKGRNIYVSTVTNGMLLDENKAEKILKSGLDRIYFSIDSADSEGYSKYRVNGNLFQVQKNLKKMVELRNEKKNKLHIGIWMLLFNDNLDQLIPMLELAKKNGADELIVQSNITYRGKNNWKEIIDKMKLYRKDNEVIDNIEEAKKFAKKNQIRFSIQDGMGALKPDAKSLCKWPWKSIYIASNGDISSCCIIADPRIAYFGNILRQDFNEIWNGEKYQNFRKSLLESKIPQYCKECYRD
jgi:radical SAM protein with 4Fe4S-binding SPASM domain